MPATSFEYTSKPNPVDSYRFKLDACLDFMSIVSCPYRCCHLAGYIAGVFQNFFFFFFFFFWFSFIHLLSSMSLLVWQPHFVLNAHDGAGHRNLLTHNWIYFLFIKDPPDCTGLVCQRVETRAGHGLSANVNLDKTRLSKRLSYL